MNLMEQLKILWHGAPQEPPGIVMPEGSEPKSEPFVVFPCKECEQPITIEERIYPGQVAVIDCPNCETSHTVYNPYLQIYRTKELPPHLQKPVWEILSA